MKTIPVDQVSSMPLSLILQLVVGFAILAIGIAIINKKPLQDKKRGIIRGLIIGAVAGAAMTGIFFCVEVTTANMNNDKLQAATTAEGYNLTHEQVDTLRTETILQFGDDETLLFSDEGNGYNLTTFDESENKQTQEETAKKEADKITNNDY